MDFTSSDINATKLHIHAWDLTEYSNIWTIKIKELDTSTEVTSATTNEKKYNANVEITGSFSGEKVKTGLKFGASTEEKNSTSRTSKWIEAGDFITKFDAPFYDRVLNRNPCNGQLYPRLYTSSSAAVEIRPVQVEF